MLQKHNCCLNGLNYNKDAPICEVWFTFFVVENFDTMYQIGIYLIIKRNRKIIKHLTQFVILRKIVTSGV